MPPDRLDSRPGPRPEVLSPAGSPEALAAAVQAGADAVYFGLTDFNARIRARNFELGDLPDVLLDLRRWGVKSYLVFNTLVFLEEMPAARRLLEAIAEAGPDGIIVQDLGLLRLVRRLAPGLAVHASTQMTVGSADGVRLAARLGASRVILARELTLPEIARIRSEVETELEVFVHGALCVSWSGQCLSSEAWGGRSANRGQCAQACRLPYDLIVDGGRRDLGDRAYLLSPRDLEGYRRVPELVALGIAALKIEGRMKSAEYVASATALYREAVDRACELRGVDGAIPLRPSLDRLAGEAAQVFSRGGGEGFLGGVNHQRLVDGRIRAHRGLLAGVVARVDRDREGPGGAIVLQEAAAAPGTTAVHLKPGDGILLAISPREEDEVGGRLLSAEPAGPPGHRILRFPRRAMPDLTKVRPGVPVYRTSDPALLERLRRDLRPETGPRRVPLRASVEGAPGKPLTLRLEDPEGRAVEVRSEQPCAEARSRGLTAASARELLERFGATRYRLAGVEVRGAGDFFLPVSELNRLRREAVAAMEAARGAPPAPATAPCAPEAMAGAMAPVPVDAAPATEGDGSAEAWPAVASEDVRSKRQSGPVGAAGSPVIWAVERAGRAEESAGAAAGGPQGALAAPAATGSFEEATIVVCRDADQMRGALDAGVRRIALDFLDLVGLKEAAVELRRLGARRTLALPRAQKPGEERIETFFLGLEPEELLVRNLGSIERLNRLRRSVTAAGAEERGWPLLVGDVSLNAVNPQSIAVLSRLGLARVSPGLDLSGEQLETLAGAVEAARLEIPIHHHLPVFHTEHCVFAAFLSDGADFRTCGRPCDRHRIELRDRTGQSHPVVADVGCRNTVFGARPQSVLRHLQALRGAGVRHFRLELITQSRDEARRLIDRHRATWEGRAGWEDTVRALHAESAYGVTLGPPAAPNAPPKPAGSRAKPAGFRAKPPGGGPTRKPAADGRPRRFESAADGRPRRFEPAADGRSGRFEPAADGRSGRFEPSAVGRSRRFEPSADGRVQPSARAPGRKRRDRHGGFQEGPGVRGGAGEVFHGRTEESSRRRAEGRAADQASRHARDRTDRAGRKTSGSDRRRGSGRPEPTGPAGRTARTGRPGPRGPAGRGTDGVRGPGGSRAGGPERKRPHRPGGRPPR